MEKIKVLAVDDSALIRELLREIVNSDSELEMIATAANPIFAEKKIEKMQPDVVTLDIEMPQMDGLTFLKKLMKENPIPVIMFSSVLEKHREYTLDALSIGAFDYVLKPSAQVKEGVEELRDQLIGKIKAAYRNRNKIVSKAKAKSGESKIEKARPDLSVNRAEKKAEAPVKKERSPHFFTSAEGVPDKHTADAVLSLDGGSRGDTPNSPIIVVGASTGGTEAIVKMLENVTSDTPPIVITQHMPQYFTLSFANRLDKLFPIDVREAKNGDELKPGVCLIAAGGMHTLLKSRAGKYFVEVREGPLVNRHKPSVDVLFRSAAKYAGNKAVGIILTGMGDDGARGMKEMKDRGAYNIAQDEDTCIVYGMPKEAVKMGGVDVTLAVDKILAEALKVAKKL